MRTEDPVTIRREDYALPSYAITSVTVSYTHLTLPTIYSV